MFESEGTVPVELHRGAAGCVSARTGKYLYAIAPLAAGGCVYGNIGMNGMPVYTISTGRTSAVVSDFPDENVRPERQRVAAHHQVLKRLMAERTVLPMAFGIVAEDREAVLRTLSVNQAAFVEQLERVDGKVEMGLRVVWDVPNIFEYFVATDAELRALRDGLFGGPRLPSHEDKIELGRQFDRVLNERRQVHTHTVLEVLGPVCAEMADTGTKNEREVMTLACLVRRDRRDAFEEGVFAAAQSFDNDYSFDFSGPWPPHNFVDVDLRT